jgi:hypothetical protein
LIEQLPSRSGEVEFLGEWNKLNIAGAQIFKETDQVRQWSPESVQLPHQQDSELSALGSREHFIKRRARTLRPAESFIEVFMQDFKTTAVLELAKISNLHFRALVCEGTDTPIDRGLL